jgi:hypothetical protein
MVFKTSGMVNFSAERFATYATWNLVHPPIAPSDNAIRVSSFEKLMERPVPETPLQLLYAIFQRPAIYIEYYFKPVMIATALQLKKPLVSWMWLPWTLIGLFVSRNEKAWLSTVTFLTVTVLLVGIMTTFVWSARFWFPLMVISTPFAAKGLVTIAQWAKAFIKSCMKNNLLSRFAYYLVLGFGLITISLGSYFECFAVDRTKPELIMRVGAFFNSSEAPPLGSRIYTSTAKIHLWEPNYDWIKIPKFDSAQQVVEFQWLSELGKPSYLLLENDHGGGCVVLQALFENKNACEKTSENLEWDLPKYKVLKTFVEGSHAIWLIELK